MTRVKGAKPKYSVSGHRLPLTRVRDACQRVFSNLLLKVHFSIYTDACQRVFPNLVERYIISIHPSFYSFVPIHLAIHLCLSIRSSASVHLYPFITLSICTHRSMSPSLYPSICMYPFLSIPHFIHLKLELKSTTSTEVEIYHFNSS